MLRDFSVIALLVSNVIVIIMAIVAKWQTDAFLWAYWFQSIIIGFFHFLRILYLQNFSTENFTVNNQPQSPTAAIKTFTAFFFAFHFGLFHFVYAMLLGAFFTTDFRFVTASFGLSAFIFFINHLFSFLYNRKNDEKNKPNLGKLLFAPYSRILPIHLTILIGALFNQRFILILFLLIKTGVDIVLHTFKHRPSSLFPKTKQSLASNP